jgi:hypothetical protein
LVTTATNPFLLVETHDVLTNEEHQEFDKNILNKNAITNLPPSKLDVEDATCLLQFILSQVPDHLNLAFLRLAPVTKLIKYDPRLLKALNDAWKKKASSGIRNLGGLSSYRCIGRVLSYCRNITK